MLNKCIESFASLIRTLKTLHFRAPNANAWQNQMKHMRKIFIILFCFPALASGNQVFDATSTQAFIDSVSDIVSNLPEGRKQKFSKALQIYKENMRFPISEFSLVYDTLTDNLLSEAALHNLNGKTVDYLINEAEKMNEIELNEKNNALIEKHTKENISTVNEFVKKYLYKISIETSIDKIIPFWSQKRIDFFNKRNNTFTGNEAYRDKVKGIIAFKHIVDLKQYKGFIIKSTKVVSGTKAFITVENSAGNYGKSIWEIILIKEQNNWKVLDDFIGTPWREPGNLLWSF